MTERHGNRPGMTGFTCKTHTDAALPGNRRNHSNRDIVCLKHRPLLNMDFAVPQEFVAAPARGAQGMRVRIAPKDANRLGHRDPISIS